jgi:hypothetical protein
MSLLPSIGFDTSAINTLADGSPTSDHLVKALQCGFDVRLPAMSVEEILAAPDSQRRELLLARCQQMLVSGQCVWPPLTGSFAK